MNPIVLMPLLMKTDLGPVRDAVLAVVRDCPGLRWSQVADRLPQFAFGIIEDAVYELWREGEVQINPDSTLRLPRPGERIFRYDG